MRKSQGAATCSKKLISSVLAKLWILVRRLFWEFGFLALRSSKAYVSLRSKPVKTLMPLNPDGAIWKMPNNKKYLEAYGEGPQKETLWHEINKWVNYVFTVIAGNWRDILSKEANSANLFVIFFSVKILPYRKPRDTPLNNTPFLASLLSGAGRMIPILNVTLYLQILTHLILLRILWCSTLFHGWENQGMKMIISMLLELRFKTKAFWF